jgi:hypothetical protein
LLTRHPILRPKLGIKPILPQEVPHAHSEKITQIGHCKKAKGSIRHSENPEQVSPGDEDHQPEADKCISAQSLLTTFPANALAVGNHNRRPFFAPRLFFFRALA